MTLAQKKAIADRLAQLTQLNGGRLTPEAVVADAADANSPMHGQFEWDDTEAARQYRLDQARTLIRSVKINEIVDQRTVQVVAYVHDPSDQSEPGYVPTVSLVNDRERALETLQREFTRIEGSVNRSRAIAQVLGLEAELDGLLGNITQFIAGLRAA
jgi:hypothetical protein